MSLDDLQELLSRRRSAIQLVIELGGLAVAATALVWIGQMKERFAAVEQRLAAVEQKVNEVYLVAVANGAIKPPQLPSQLVSETSSAPHP